MPVVIAPDSLQAFLECVFVRAGCGADEATTVARHFVLSDMSGHSSHGTIRLPVYLERLRDREIMPGNRGEPVVDTEALLVLDGHLGFGQVVAEHGIAQGIDRARRHGVALIAMRNMSHCGRVGHYAELAADAGQASIHFVNTGGFGLWVAPFGGTDRRLATNPVCIGIPRENAPPVIWDVATSVIAVGKIWVAANKGDVLPPGCLLDVDGAPTTDPHALLAGGAVVPFGGYKGYGLSIVTDLLAGALTGGGCSKPGVDVLVNNQLSILMDPESIGDAAAFEVEARRFIEWVKASPPVEGGAVLVPGEPEVQSRREATEAGLCFDETTWAQCVDAARSVGMSTVEIEALVAAPAEIGA